MSAKPVVLGALVNLRTGYWEQAMDTNKVGKKPRGNSGIAEAGIATRFTPGQSGNPSGRPRRTPYADAHRTVAQLPVVELSLIHI